MHAQGIYWSVAGALLLSACIADEPLPGETDGDSGETSSESGVGDESGSSTAGVSSTSVTSSTTSTTGAEGDTGAGAMHASCSTPMPQPPPPLPNVNYQGETPEFALWQSLACDDPAVAGAVTCEEDPDCPENNCVDFGGTAGVCSYGDIDVWCDGEGYATGTSDGSCWICIEPFEHARACCDFPDGIFDCRQWPFNESPGTIGQVCATHEDCELGLACSEPSGGNAGYGICACPETESAEILPPDPCFE